MISASRRRIAGALAVRVHDRAGAAETHPYVSRAGRLCAHAIRGSATVLCVNRSDHGRREPLYET